MKIVAFVLLGLAAVFITASVWRYLRVRRAIRAAFHRSKVDPEYVERLAKGVLLGEYKLELREVHAPLLGKFYYMPSSSGWSPVVSKEEFETIKRLVEQLWQEVFSKT